MKSGRLSKNEKSFIDSNLENMTDEEMAKKLGRSVEAVSQRRSVAPQENANDELQSYISQLHSKHFWVTIKKSLLNEELETFENSWASLYSQFFHQGVTATDEIMMKDVIIEDILLHRALEQKKNILEEIKDYENQLAEERKKDIEERDSDFMTNALRTIVQLRGTSEAYTKEINEIKKTKDGKFKDLKATRNERLKTVEESGKDIFALIKLLDEQKLRETEGRMTGLVYEAAKTKEGQMRQEMVFADGEVDRAWLTPEAELEEEQKE
ncbi:MAG TPA: hypothetical protein DHV30_00420 [Balneola sp.]|nr:hypothetical protein [Balneola sp.]|tara:strand:+ start:5463 stop:6266 length:804 start_codon:yes stop_codon:yes gene_type:complete